MVEEEVSERELILNAITDRGGQPRQTKPLFNPLAEQDLWDAFEKELFALGGQLIEDIKTYKSKPCWVDPALESELNLKSTAPTIWDAEVGFSKAEFAVAQTGTLVLSAGQDKYRLSSLVPPINIVVVKRDQIVPTLTHAMSRLPKETSFFVTGPSRTTDIEGVLVRGVHGPRELLVYRI